MKAARRNAWSDWSDFIVITTNANHEIQLRNELPGADACRSELQHIRRKILLSQTVANISRRPSQNKIKKTPLVRLKKHNPQPSIPIRPS